jgi:hypothetical protein
MIWQPKAGMRVKANYRYKWMPYQGAEGTVLIFINHGKGPKSAIVRFDGHKQSVIIPRGNLNYSKKKPGGARPGSAGARS